MVHFQKYIVIAASLSVSACNTFSPPDGPPVASTAVSPVVTEHSFGLQCLGQLIDDSRLDPVIVHVDKIRDRTIPKRLTRESRLSQAGEWLIHTAISKMETERVRSTLTDSENASGKSDHMVISGAWTQDDELVRQNVGDGDLGSMSFVFGLGGSRRSDYIAGDFTSSVNDLVTFASAVGVVVGSGDLDAHLFVENSGEFLDVSFERRWADGPQMAQRRIAEAAVLVHVARYFGVDYRPCLQTGWSSPAHYEASVNNFRKASVKSQNSMTQAMLANMGYDTGGLTGDWTEASTRAMSAFQSENGLPVTGRNSSVNYALLSAYFARKSSEAAAAAAQASSGSGE